MLLREKTKYLWRCDEIPVSSLPVSRVRNSLLPLSLGYESNGVCVLGSTSGEITVSGLRGAISFYDPRMITCISGNDNYIAVAYENSDVVIFHIDFYTNQVIIDSIDILYS